MSLRIAILGRKHGRRSWSVATFLLASVILAFAPPLQAQSTLVVEGRGGVALPAGSLPSAWAEGSAGPATGVSFALRRGERSYLYLGFSQLRTACDGAGCGGARVNTQWEAGVRLDLRTTGIVPWLRVGAISPSVERIPLAPTAGEASRYGLSERGWGGEIGGGVRFPIAERVGLSPGVRYLMARVGDHSPEPVTMRWVVAELGLVVGF